VEMGFLKRPNRINFLLYDSKKYSDVDASCSIPMRRVTPVQILPHLRRLVSTSQHSPVQRKLKTVGVLLCSMGQGRQTLLEGLAWVS